jgi:glycine cleavage system H protein
MSKPEPFRFLDYVIVGALTIGALALVPLFAVLGFAAQFGFVVVMPAVLVGGMVHALSTRPELVVTQVHGVDVPDDVRLHPKHGWARRASPNCVVTGADDFAQRVVGPVEAIDTPPVGTHLHEGDVLAVLRHGARAITIRAPIDGTVSQVNPALSEPDVVNRSPYGRGWIVELAPEKETVKESLKRLLGGGRAIRWMRSEVDRLVALTSPPALGQTAADGGELGSDLGEHLDERTWRRVVDEFFA